MLPAMSLGVSNLGGRGEGDHLGLPPLPFRVMGGGWRWGVEKLFGCTLGPEERARERNLRHGVQSEIKKGDRGETLGLEKRVWVSDLPCVGFLGLRYAACNSRFCRQGPQKLSLLQALGSSPSGGEIAKGRYQEWP